MNPFDWAGPQFLGFYAIFAATVLAFLWARTQGAAETRATLSFMTGDPYRIAFMRKGEEETLQIAIFNLVDRGLLELRNGLLTAPREAAADLVRRPLDRAILSTCREGTTPSGLVADPVLRRMAGQYRRELAANGLVASEDDRRGRQWLFVASAGLLAGVSVVKIVVALARGRHNIAFLVILTIVACVVALAVCNRSMSRAGREMLSNLKGLTKRLMMRADTLRPGGATNEALLLASVYGLWALPSAIFPMVALLFPRPTSSDSSGGDGSSSDGGGGGGCGGGCGGCGGE